MPSIVRNLLNITSYLVKNVYNKDRIDGSVFMELTSIANPRVKQWSKYHDKKHREADQRFLVEGEHLIQEAMKAGLVETLLLNRCPYQFNFSGETLKVSDEVMKKLTSNVSLPSCIAVCIYPNQVIELGNKILLLDDVQDPGNVGTLIRTAHSFGFDSVVLSKKSVDLYNEKLIRSTQGAIFYMPVIKAELLEVIAECKTKSLPVYATALQDAKPLSSFTNSASVALIMGNEGKGVSEEILAVADDKIYIEMRTFESLNVAVAGGICMYAFRNN